MPRIKLKTEIKAKKKIVFDLSRSIDLHKISTKHTNESAIDGKTHGLIEINESVTWKAKHFGFYQKLTSKIIEFESPNLFVDEMVQGAFKKFRHEHHFQDFNNGTLMIDFFDYESLFGVLGQLANKLFLNTYLINLLEKRNEIIKEFAESDNWKKVLPIK